MKNYYSWKFFIKIDQEEYAEKKIIFRPRVFPALDHEK